MQGRNLMDQAKFQRLQANLEKRWEAEAHRRHEQQRAAERAAAAAAQEQQQAAVLADRTNTDAQLVAAPPAPAAAVRGPVAASRRNSLPPRGPVAKAAALARAPVSADGFSKTSEMPLGQAQAEVAGHPRRALGELPVQQ